MILVFFLCSRTRTVLLTFRRWPIVPVMSWSFVSSQTRSASHLHKCSTTRQTQVVSTHKQWVLSASLKIPRRRRRRHQAHRTNPMARPNVGALRTFSNRFPLLRRSLSFRLIFRNPCDKTSSLPFLQKINLLDPVPLTTVWILSYISYPYHTAIQTSSGHHASYISLYILALFLYSTSYFRYTGHSSSCDTHSKHVGWCEKKLNITKFAKTLWWHGLVKLSGVWLVS